MATTKRAATPKTKAAAKPAEAPEVADVTEVTKKITPKEVDPHEYVTVRNGSRGKLIYISPRTGERFVWEEFGDEQELELQELRNAKAANKKFYERNWFMFDEEYEWVIDYLGVGAFYRNAININHFDDLFQKTPKEIADILKGLSDGQKRSVSYRARQLIAEGEIDSMKVIDALEKGLGVELVER